MVSDYLYYFENDIPNIYGFKLLRYIAEICNSEMIQNYTIYSTLTSF